MLDEDDIWISLKPGDLVRIDNFDLWFCIDNRNGKFKDCYPVEHLSGEKIGIFIGEHCPPLGIWKGRGPHFCFKVLVNDRVIYYPSSKRVVDGETQYQILQEGKIEKC